MFALQRQQHWVNMKIMDGCHREMTAKKRKKSITISCIISLRLLCLTYAVWNDIQQVLCEQQVSKSQEAIELCRKLLQTILWHIQTHQSAEVPQLLHTHAIKITLRWSCADNTTTIFKSKTRWGNVWVVNPAWDISQWFLEKGSCNSGGVKMFISRHVNSLVVMRTTGYGPATAPSGWGEHQGCPAKRWEEVVYFC